MPLAGALVAALGISTLVAAVLAAVMTSLGQHDNLAKVLQDITAAAGEAKVDLLQKLAQMVQGAIVQPLGQSALAAQNLTATFVAAAFSSAILPMIAAARQTAAAAPAGIITEYPPPVTLPTPSLYLPTFATTVQLEAWYKEQLRLYNLGQITVAQRTVAIQHYIAQRFLVAQAEAAAAPVVVAPGQLPIVPLQPVAPAAAPPAVNVYNQNIVNVPPQVLPTIQVNNTIPVPGVYPTIDTAPIAMALPAVGAAFAAAMVANAGALGHGMNMGRNTCFSSTGNALMGMLMPGVQIAGIMAFLNAPDSLRGIVDPITRTLFDSLFTFPEIERPITPDQAPRVAESIFLRAVGLGISAHLAAQVSEAFTSAKFMGIPYLAAMMADMAGFGRIAAATMGVVESQALGLPMRYYVNKQVRTQLPDVGTLRGLAGEYALVPRGEFDRLTESEAGLEQLNQLNYDEYAKWLPYTGYADEWTPKLYELADRPASYFALRAVADSGMWDEAYYIRELANNGYNVPTIRKMLQMLRRMTLQDAITLLAGESRYDYLDGFISGDVYRADLEGLGFDETKADAMLAGSEQRRTRLMQRRQITLLQSGVVKGRIRIEDMQTQLRDMGIVDDVLDLYMRETAMKVNIEREPPPKRTLSESEVARLYQDRKLSYEAALERIALEFRSRDDAVKYLELYPPKEKPEKVIKPELLTPAQIGRLYQLEKMEHAEALRRLTEREPPLVDPELFLLLYERDEPKIAEEIINEVTASQIGTLYKMGLLPYRYSHDWLVRHHYSKRDAEFFLALYVPTQVID